MLIDDLKIIVVGATGYIGRSLFKRANVYGTAMGTSTAEADGLIPLRLDDPSNFDYGKIGVGNVVLLTAAISSPDICAREHDQAWRVNVNGTSAFIENVISHGGRVLFFSSDAIYGECDKEFDETRISNPTGEYAAMKREVEGRFDGTSSFKAVRLSYVFSSEDKFTRYLAGCAQRNEEAELFHPFYRAIVHREDVIAGALAVAERWHEIPEQFINFGGPQVLSRVDFAECLRKVHFNGLRFKVTEPGEDFFKNRPRVIAMTSPVFARLLGRRPRRLCEAARMEFGSLSNTQRAL